MRPYVAGQIDPLLDRLAAALEEAAADPQEKSIHRLRTSIRRLSGALRVFAEFFPTTVVRKVRRQLREVMTAAGDVRNRDIALMLLQRAGVPVDGPLGGQLSSERTAAQEELVRQLRRLHERDRIPRWRQKLGLCSPEVTPDAA